MQPTIVATAITSSLHLIKSLSRSVRKGPEDPKDSGVRGTDFDSEGEERRHRPPLGAENVVEAISRIVADTERCPRLFKKRGYIVQ